MKSSTYFRAFSYLTIAVAMLALALAGGLSYVLAVGFGLVMILSWRLEETKWQLPERIGLVVVLLSIPLFYLDWQYQKSAGEPVERLGVTALAHLIVFLSAVKLLQVKKDRDWVFLYLISFFELLLAAGLSFSPLFLLTLTLYLLMALSAVIAFEIQKARRSVTHAETRLLVPPDSHVFRKGRLTSWRHNEGLRLPLVAVALLVLIFVLALPLFLIAPRSNAAAFTRSGASLGHFIGFSENVRLGEIGNLKRDDEVVMHVRIDDGQPGRDLRWRGIALDEFTGVGWKKSLEAQRGLDAQRSPSGLFKISPVESLHRLVTQTFFLEPLESTAIFAAPKAVAVQGDLPFVRVDAEGGLRSRRHEFERIIYKAVSDSTEPDIEALRSDLRAYPPEYNRYLQLPPTLDSRINSLALAILVKNQARNRYDAAKAIETELQTSYGYSLQMRAGGPDPLSDFLFNIKAGHCEYFSTAMAIMLRTRGIAARVVNGFLPGEYNDAAGAFTVRQSDAHSWVEVYFPETRTWVTFDPTPAAGRTEPVRSGVTAQLQKYAEALELVWFQYVVGYDSQEQRSLATSFHDRLFNLGRLSSHLIEIVQPLLSGNYWWLLLLIGVFVALGLIFLLRRIKFLGWRRALGVGEQDSTSEVSRVVFYERLTNALARAGWERESHLTPTEFAQKTGIAEAALITRAYNNVRFGKAKLSSAELREINTALMKLEAVQK